MIQVNLTQEDIDYLTVLLEQNEETIRKQMKKMPPLSYSSAIRNITNIRDSLEAAELF